MTDFVILKLFTSPSSLTLIMQDRVSLSSPGTSEQIPFESRSGSIGITLSGRYTLVPRARASVSSGVCGRT